MKSYIFTGIALLCAALIIAAPQYGSPLCTSPGRCFNSTAYNAPGKYNSGHFVPANTSTYVQPQHGNNYTRPINGAPYTPPRNYTGMYMHLG